MKPEAVGILKATRRQRGRAVTRRVTDGRSRASEGPRSDASRPATDLAAREWEGALPFPSARKDRIRFPCVEAYGPWLNLRGVIRNDPGSRRLSTA